MCADSISRTGVFSKAPLARQLWPPRVLRMAPVDPFEQIAELAGRDRHRAIRRRRPHEAPPLQALGVQRGAQTVVPEDLDQLATLAPEDIEIAGMRVALQRLLDAQGQRVHAAAHVRVTGRDPHSHA